jgi:hypothetical protein
MHGLSKLPLCKSRRRTASIRDVPARGLATGEPPQSARRPHAGTQAPWSRKSSTWRRRQGRQVDAPGKLDSFVLDGGGHLWGAKTDPFLCTEPPSISSAAALGHGDVLLSVIDDVNARAVRARTGAPAAAEVLGHAEAVTPPRAVVAVAVMPPRAVAAVAFGGVALVAGAIALAGALVPVGAAVRVPAPAVPAPAPPASPPFFAGVVA